MIAAGIDELPESRPNAYVRECPINDISEWCGDPREFLLEQLLKR
jgi:hypothetical protein